MTEPLHIEADVLVVGGGLAATWAATGAARTGARVVLVDKGYCGTSGVTAAAGPGHWWVAPDKREEAIEKQVERARGLADPGWMARVLDLTWTSLPGLDRYYRFPRDQAGAPRYRSMRGPEYLKAMRRLIQDLGVAVLDHSPALELLLHDDGSVAGAAGVQRQAGRDWTARVGAVVLATGGCGFRSRLLGSHTNTGDGLLMAAEAGVELSGMEFSTYHTVSPARSSMTRSVSYAFASYRDASGFPIEVTATDSTPALARALLAGPVFCRLHRMPHHIRERLHLIQPNAQLPFVRAGIDPFEDWFEITLRGEGTIRGVGGLKVAGEDCQTGVHGLFVAGDTASREPIAGAVSGGGAQNSSWALSSGQWAGAAAARLAFKEGRRLSGRARAIGRAGLRPGRAAGGVSPEEVVAAVQAETLPFDKAVFRTSEQLAASLDALEYAWCEARDHLRGTGRSALAAREAAAMAATARWCAAAAFRRIESRGLHRREDHPLEDSRLARRLTIRGLNLMQVQFAESQPAQDAAA